MGDGEDADAALRVAGFADEMRAAALVGVGHGCVYDLDEGLRHGVGDGWLGGFALEGGLLGAGEGVLSLDRCCGRSGEGLVAALRLGSCFFAHSLEFLGLGA